MLADIPVTLHKKPRKSGKVTGHADANKKIVYTVTFGNDMNLKNGDKSMAVSCMEGENALTDESKVTVFDGTSTIDSVVTASVAEAFWAAAGGTYTEVLTFIAVVDATFAILYQQDDGEILSDVSKTSAVAGETVTLKIENDASGSTLYVNVYYTSNGDDIEIMCAIASEDAKLPGKTVGSFGVFTNNGFVRFFFAFLADVGVIAVYPVDISRRKNLETMVILRTDDDHFAAAFRAALI